MTYTWFYIFNSTEFATENLVSRSLYLLLDGIGQKTILITKGIGFGVEYEGVFLPVKLNDENPFEFESLAVYQDDDDNIWLGVAVEN